MDPERWREVDRLFAEVLERPPAERPPFLDSACAGDTALRREVERLLAADEQGASFLGGGPGELLELALDDREGGSLGPYRLLRRIGSGGMGTVYLARREDEHYRRDVAIKVLRSGLASTESYHRFIAERQILARLEHPNIARLYDGGSTDDGRPYLVMELIDGIPVDQYCDRHRLTVDQRLALFQKICAAVQHAHQNLLVHRDLKPGNILVTPEGEPKLLDFGIAKRLAPGLDGDLQQTRTGLRMMTPSYASPEQVRGDAITTASDVYSLGVLLAELLAGRSPFPAATDVPYEIERAICEQEPERPSLALFRRGSPSAEEIAQARKTKPQTLRHRLQGDLDNIVLMALRKESRRRYGSAAALARDLEKHLQDLPVMARPDTLRYRTRKLLRRHRAAVAAAAVVLLLATVFVASLVDQRRQFAQERDKARYALAFLVDTFRQADPNHTQGERLTARAILDQGAGRIARELSGQPDVQAAMMDAIGEVDFGLGRYAEAEPLLKRSLALRRQVFGPGSLEVAESLEHLAGLRNEHCDRAGAESQLREALAIRRRRLGDGDIAVASTLNALGKTLAAKGVSPATAPEIAALYLEGLTIARRVEGPEGLTVAETLLALADLRRAQGSYAGAEHLSLEGLDIEEKALGDRDPRLWRDRSRLGDTLIEAGKFQEAEAVFRRNLKVQRRFLGPQHPDVASTLGGLATAINRQGRYTEAEALDHEVLALARSHDGPANWRVADALCNLAASLTGQSRTAEAIPLYEKALDIRRRTLGKKHWQVAQVLLLLAELHRTDKSFPKALQLANQARDIFEAGEGPDHPHTASALHEIGMSYLDQGRFAEAEPFLHRCLDIRHKRLEIHHPDLAQAQVALARCLLGKGRDGEAAALLQAARTTFLAVYGPSHKILELPDALLAEIKGRHVTPEGKLSRPATV